MTNQKIDPCSNHKNIIVMFQPHLRVRLFFIWTCGIIGEFQPSDFEYRMRFLLTFRVRKSILMTVKVAIPSMTFRTSLTRIPLQISQLLGWWRDRAVLSAEQILQSRGRSVCQCRRCRSHQSFVRSTDDQSVWLLCKQSCQWNRYVRNVFGI